MESVLQDEQCIVAIDVERVRLNLSEGFGWRKNATLPGAKARKHLRDIGFTPIDEEKQLYSGCRSDLAALRPNEILSVQPLEDEPEVATS
jgi:hypothetical protein